MQTGIILKHAKTAQRSLVGGVAALAVGLYQSNTQIWCAGLMIVAVAAAYLARKYDRRVEAVFQFLGSVMTETRNCTVPSKAQVVDAVSHVLILVATLACYLFLIDLGTIKVLEMLGVTGSTVQVSADSGE